MALIDPSGSAGFWGVQCGARQPGLSHVHESNCTDGHVAGQCCECGIRDVDWKREADFAVREAGAVPEPIDVNARLRALGLLPTEDEHPVETVRDYETYAVASAWVTRQGRKLRTRLVGLRGWYEARPEDFQ